jgi:hypothetical protein
LPHTKNLSNFEKFQLFYDKIDPNTNFANLPSVKWLFCMNVRIEVLQNYSAFYCVGLLAKENLRGLFLQKNPAIETTHLRTFMYNESGSAVKEIGLAGPKKDHLFCAIHKANEIGGAQAERILEKTSENNYFVL